MMTLVPNGLLETLQSLAEGSSADDTSKIALFSAIGLAAAAFITGGFNLITTMVSRLHHTDTGQPDLYHRLAGDDDAERIQALSIFIALHTDADPSKIKTGYESSKEVHRAV